MSLKYCQKDCHQDQPVAFIIKENQNWVLCCAMCQYESDLPKQQFTAIKDLEKINKETQAKIDQSDVIHNLQNTLTTVKQWQSQFETVISEIKSSIQYKIDYFSSLNQTLNQNIEFFIINNEKLQEVLNCREELKVNLKKYADDIENLRSNLTDSYGVLQLSSPFQQVEILIETKVPSIIDGQTDQQGKSNSNSIINEQNQNNNNNTLTKLNQEFEQLKINQEFRQLNVPNQNTMTIQKNQEIKQQGKIQINENEYYEGEIYNGKMHGKGKIVKNTPLYECIFEGNFFENKKHGEFIETQIEKENQDINQSFFKRVNLIKPQNQKKIQLKGMYKNDKKTEVFTKISYINDTKESEIYQFYEDDVLIEEFE